MNIANGEIKKLTEEIAPKEKAATPPVQKVTPPLEPITEHSDEADKSIPATKPGKRSNPMVMKFLYMSNFNNQWK